MPIRVTNRRGDSPRHPEPDEVVIDIGRPNPLGNPYQLGRGVGFSNLAERERVIGRYRVHLEREMTKKTGPVHGELRRIVGLVRRGEKVALNCWCAPLPCHGDVIAKMVEKIVESNDEK